jgi:hypothetical protein
MRFIANLLPLCIALILSTQSYAQGTAVAERISGASTSSSGSSSSSFEITMRVPPKTGFFDTVSTEDTVRVSASIFLPSFNIREAVKVYVVVAYEGSLFYLQKRSIGGPWNGDLNSLPAYEDTVFFSNQFNLTAYEGLLPKGEFDFYIAYFRGGQFHFSSAPKRFTVTGENPTPITPDTPVQIDNPFVVYDFDSTARDTSGNGFHALGLNGVTAIKGVKSSAFSLD